MAKQKTQSPRPQRIKVKYEDTAVRYANQVMLNGSAEELFLEFSSGPVPDPATGESIVPVHTRIAMTPGSARRLLAALQQTLKRVEASKVAMQASAKPASK